MAYRTYCEENSAFYRVYRSGHPFSLKLQDMDAERNQETQAGSRTGLSCAFCDETIQLFVDGRSGQVDDVWLDLCGVVCGLVLTTALAFMRNTDRGKLR